LGHLFEELPTGYIDWTEGYYYGIGTGFGNTSASARRAATVVAMREVLVVAGNIRVDARTSVRELGESYVRRIQGTISDHLVVDEGWADSPEGRHYEVVLRVPMHGVSNLSGVIYGKVVKRYRKRSRPPVVAEADLDEAIVIDARGLGAVPAMFPRVLSASGRAVYDVTDVSREDAVEKGIVVYATSELPFEELANTTGEPSSDRISLPGRVRLLARSPSAGRFVLTADEESESKPRRRRFARKRVVVKAEDVKGDAPTDIVVADDDARKLTQTEGTNAVLAKGNVIVITDSSTAAIEGRLPTLDEALEMVAER
jgi:hypothetical protein